MKKIKIYMMFLAVFALLLTSCSKEDEAVNENDNLATLSFTTVLNDLVANKASLKQQLDIPECTDDAPVFVAVVLTGETNVGTVEDPIIVSVNPDPDNFDDDAEEEYFTEESSDLELVPGEYTLEYFAVYNGDPSETGTEVIWVAPREGGELASFVDTPLPLTFDLGPGAKKYVDVEVLCFDDRMVNEYGYLFFDLETSRAIEFCVFGNFCDANGRHFPAAFSVSVWEYADGDQGDIIHENLTNTVTENNDGDFSASTLCLALPDTSGEDQYWVEITLLDSEAYDTDERIIRSGVVTDAEVRALFSGDDAVDYYHFREGNCDSGDVPQLFDGDEEPIDEDGDNDGIVDEDDNCPEVANPGQEDFDEDGLGNVCDPDIDGDGVDNETDLCDNEVPTTDADNDGCQDGSETDNDSDDDGVEDDNDNCPEVPNAGQEDLDGDGLGDACDPDIDGDGVNNEADACDDVVPTTDADNDGCQDAETDSDSDDDGIDDENDNCDDTANPDQADFDNDGVGDVCEAATTCTIDSPNSGCDRVLLEGTSDFVLVQDGTTPLDLLNGDGEPFAPIALVIENGNVSVEGGLILNHHFTDYIIEVSPTATGVGAVTVCGSFTAGQALNVNTDFGNLDATYGEVYLRIIGNVCPDPAAN